ncbi:MAG TPA: membrane protein insertion efficiency factor YidD [Arthrobacter sp.]|jgi:putative membrane protein insertion efficiency factor|nr:membrane protein insertion efficiency factor YidD [Arthrobacter sp.]
MSTTSHSPVQPPAAASVAHFFWTLPQKSLIGLLKAYRKVISPVYGQVCRFFPSCSAYALEAVTVHGAVKGTWLALRRLSRCHPWNDGGVDHVPSSPYYERLLRENPAGTPRIIVLNHPEIPADDEGRPSGPRS